MRPRSQLLAPCMLLLGATACNPAQAQNTLLEDELRRQVRERDAEIADLRQQLDRLNAQQRAPASPSTASTGTAPPVTGRSVNAAGPPSTSRRSGVAEDDEITTALESSLVRQGGAVLSAGTVEVEPELSYFYAEPTRGRRRDAFGTALSLRFGLPASTQLDLYVPYVIHDRQDGLGSTSGIGDVRLGVIKQLVRDREGTPALLVFGRWRTTTGDINRVPPTGFGQHALQVGLSATKRMDPVLLFGSVSYTGNFGSARLRTGERLDAGNVLGARFGANLAATPGTSFYWGGAYGSSSADRFNGERVDFTDRASGFFELGATTVIGHGRFLSLGVGFGVTPAAPKFNVTASLPFRF